MLHRISSHILCTKGGAIAPSFFSSKYCSQMISKINYHVLSEINMSLASENEQEKVYSILKKFGVSLTKITSGQRLAVYGIDDKKAATLQKELLTIVPSPPKNSVTTINTCPSLQECKYATGNTQQLGRRLEQLSFASPLPGKVKIGIAGCRVCCTQPWVRDLGIISNRKGWSLIFGGNAGNKPRIGDLIAENLSDEQLVQLVKKCLEVYIEHASPRQRTARFMEHFGVEQFKMTVK